MSNKENVVDYWGDNIFAIWCEPCNTHHGFTVTTDHWSFNGDMIKPTFNPSMLVTWNHPDHPHTCHSFVKDGNIQYLDDCLHELAGKTVALKPINIDKRFS